MTRHPLAVHVRHWPADAREEWAERAAILEYLANLPRPEAEARAEEVVRARYAPSPTR